MNRVRVIVVVMTMLCSLTMLAPPAAAQGVTTGTMAIQSGTFEFTAVGTTPGGSENLHLTGTVAGCGSGLNGTGSGWVGMLAVTFSVDWITPTTLVLGATSGNFTATLITACGIQGGASETATVFGLYL